MTSIDESEATMPSSDARQPHLTRASAAGTESQPTVRQPASTVQNPVVPEAPKGRRRAFTIFFIVLAILAAGGAAYWLYGSQFEDTDDAEVDAHLNPISARIDGTIIRVYVEDNQSVKVGDPLVDLDPRDYQVSLDQALAQLNQARSMVVAQRPNVPITQVENTTNISGAEADVANAQAALGAAIHDQASAQAKLVESQANAAKADSDLQRYKILIAKEEVSQQDYDAAVAAAKADAATVAANEAGLNSAAQTVDQRRAQLAAAQSKLTQYQRNAAAQIDIRRATVASEQANAQNAQAQVELAQLKLSYTKITAPVAGIVMKRSAEVGAHISAGQQLLTIAQINDLWVTANFKETQLRRIRPAQPVTIHVDALKQDFEGSVQNIGGSTGAVASVLPPENATGNYVKIVQRIPVRIRFKPDQPGLDRLRPGMSVEPKVRVGR
ncbi:MAG: HlyD family secretion protein [Acidobacteriaceae bacterium]|nr:HlyD family secretion protein [Acidobacteriaceae bacterium]